MSIQIFKSDKARELGLEIKTYGHFPDECFEVSFEGAVLATGEMNYHDDSDFYAVVYDAEADRVRRVEYATTRGWTYLNSAGVDATPEVIEKATKAVQRELRSSLAWALQARREVPQVGDRVRVMRGRKVPKGFEGKVARLGKTWTAGPSWRSREVDEAFVIGEGAAYNVRLSYLENLEPAAVLDARIADGLAKFDARPPAPSWRGFEYQAAAFRGADLLAARGLAGFA